MFSPLKGQPDLSEGPIETTRSSVVELFVDSSDINPGVETPGLPQLLPGALVLQADTEVPVRPGEAGGVGAGNGRGGGLVGLVTVNPHSVFFRYLGQPGPEESQASAQGDPGLDLGLGYSCRNNINYKSLIFLNFCGNLPVKFLQKGERRGFSTGIT